MKLLSVAMPSHDVNMTCLDGRELRYIKLERLRQEKRFHWASLQDWRADVEALWGAQAAQADDMVFSFDPAALPSAVRDALGGHLLRRLASGRSKAERLPVVACNFLGVQRGWLISHHYSHALSTWMLESAPVSLRVVIDGLGDGRPWSVYRGGELIAGGDIRKGSIGWGIREAGKLLGVTYGHYNDIAGKVMGLQAYGKVDPGYLQFLERFGMDRIGDIWHVAHWHAYQGDPLIGKLRLLDWVATVHCYMGRLLPDFFRQFARPDEPVSYSGGVAQNVVWNSALCAVFPQLIVVPHASDEGLSIGAMEWLRREHGLAPLSLPAFPYAQADQDVPAPSAAIIGEAARMLADGKVIGWYQGHGEIGPRALGNRSILMDPRLAHGKTLINQVKQREPYRPFGASVLAEHFDTHFEGTADPFMLYACQVRSGDFPAITHVDRSSRVQLVDGTNPVFRQLLQTFQALTGCPLLLNTSLNVAGKPIGAHPDHALQLLRSSAIDAMFIGDTVHRR